MEPTGRERSLGVTAAALIRAAPLTQQCFSPALISSAAAADLCRVVRPSFHIPLRMFTLEHPQIDPRCASAHFINPHQHHHRLTPGSPGAPTQDLARLMQSDCVLLEVTEPLHLSAADMHSIDEHRRAIIYAISYWLCRGSICVAIDLKLKKGLFCFFLLFWSVCCEEACCCRQQAGHEGSREKHSAARNDSARLCLTSIIYHQGNRQCR